MLHIVYGTNTTLISASLVRHSVHLSHMAVIIFTIFTISGADVAFLSYSPGGDSVSGGFLSSVNKSGNIYITDENFSSKLTNFTNSF